MELLRADPDLGPEPELPAVGEPVEALTSTAAESTSAMKRRAAPWSSVTIASECWLEKRLMWRIASSRSGTTRAEMSRERYSCA